MRSPSCMTLLLVAVVATGCDDSSPTAPDAPEPAARGALAGPNVAPIVSVATMTDVATAPDGIGANADIGILRRTARTAAYEVHATDLVPGHAYSVWWIVFGKPQFCVDGCNGADLSNPRVQASVFNGGGAVADGSGEATFSDLVERRETGDRQVTAGDGIRNTLKAEIHILFRSHGVAETDPADVAVQTTSTGAFCNLPPTTSPPQTPLGCQNVGFLAFPRP